MNHGRELPRLLRAAFANAAEVNKKCPVFYLHAGTAETAQHQGAVAFHGALQKAGINSVFEEVQGTAHDWQTWRCAFYGFAPRLFQKYGPAYQPEASARGERFSSLTLRVGVVAWYCHYHLRGRQPTLLAQWFAEVQR